MREARSTPSRLVDPAHHSARVHTDAYLADLEKREGGEVYTFPPGAYNIGTNPQMCSLIHRQTLRSARVAKSTPSRLVCVAPGPEDPKLTGTRL